MGAVAGTAAALLSCRFLGRREENGEVLRRDYQLSKLLPAGEAKLLLQAAMVGVPPA